MNLSKNIGQLKQLAKKIFNNHKKKLQESVPKLSTGVSSENMRSKGVGWKKLSPRKKTKVDKMSVKERPKSSSRLEGRKSIDEENPEAFIATKTQEPLSPREKRVGGNDAKIFFEKSGYLFKRGGKFGQKWQKRWIDLLYNEQNNVFDLIYKATPKAKPRGSIVIVSAKCEVVGEDNVWGIKQPLCFAIHTGGGKKSLYWFSAETKEEMNAWMHAIQQTSHFSPNNK